MTGSPTPVATPMTGLRARLRAFARCRRGGFALWVAALVPGISVLAIGAVELGKVSGDRTRLQDAADMAALTGASQLAVGSTGAIERAEATALAQLGDVAAQSKSLTADAQLGPSGSVVVDITAVRTSFFGNLLPPGGFITKVRAEAAGMTQEPICVLGLNGAAGAATVDIKDSSTVNADCTVHSNRDIVVGITAKLIAKAAQAVGVASGPITPAGRSGAEVVADPFEQRAITIPACDTFEVVDQGGFGYFEAPPGVYCGDFVIRDNLHVHMKPGAYYFMGTPTNAGKLSLKGQARLTGTDVTLYFAKTSKFEVADTAKIDLKAPRTGADAGMLIIGARDNAKTFTLASPAVDRLEGVIYLPSALLWVDGSGQLAEQSKWTIAVVKTLKINRSAQLVIKTDYAGSEVPRPGQLNSSQGVAHLIN